MKANYFIVLFLLIIMVVMTGCSSKSNPVSAEDKGEIPLKMSLAPAYQLGYDVTRVFVTIRNGGIQDSMNLLIHSDEMTAQGSFYDLIPGLYTINIKVYDDTLLIATGNGQGQVIPGQNSVVHITLQMVTGDLSIIVDWGDLFPPVPKKILFIGNSYTYANGGLWECVRQMVLAVHPDWEIITGHVTPGGYTLEAHSQYPETLNAINSGVYDLVVLQEQSLRPVDEPELFYRYAAVLDSLIKRNGGKTSFYMTHARQNNPAMINDLSFAYNHIGNQLNALVCPAGLAWNKSLQQDPGFNLYESDGSHPNYRGSYLNACVIYASIYHESPVGNTYQGYPEMSQTEKQYLQQIAWETVCEYFGWDEKWAVGY